jgi:hypothetical protein
VFIDDKKQSAANPIYSAIIPSILQRGRWAESLIEKGLYISVVSASLAILLVVFSLSLDAAVWGPLSISRIS